MSAAYRKKLIEVALPLEAINRESARENYIYRGNPSAIHKWWAQRPLAACRAVLFASLVDDPSSTPDLFPTEEQQDRERARLFDLIERLVVWENANDERLLKEASAEISRAVGDDPPRVCDPFCGGGTIPLEAQRLGLEAVASDLNPVAVALTRGLIDLPAQFVDCPPVRPSESLDVAGTWRGSQGLAADVKHYGGWMRDEAIRRIGDLYPKVRFGSETVPALAWLWTRTVACANPACGLIMPLVRSFTLSTRAGHEMQAVPRFSPGSTAVSFDIERGRSAIPETVNRRGATCVRCGTAMPLNYVAAEGMAGRLGIQLMAVVGLAARRVYVAPDAEQIETAARARPKDPPDSDLPEQALGFRVQRYGIAKHRDLFTPRQLVALETLAELVLEARDHAIKDGATFEYGNALATYLAFAVDKVVMFNSTLVPWFPKEDRQKSAFATQTVSMVWDFAEGNVLGEVGGSFLSAVRTVADAIEQLPRQERPGSVRQLDATAIDPEGRVLVSTDPPYYDNVPYADLSDVFYVWLRRMLHSIYPDLFSTLLTPKSRELVAEPARFGGSRAEANQAFESGMAEVFERVHAISDPAFPITVYYAFKQAETDGDGAGTVSTGWETMLSGLLGAGIAVTGTWPLRTERSGRMRDVASNALASSIVLVCRQRHVDAQLATRRDFIEALRKELPSALRNLQRGNIAPVDLAQASIGPGMAIYSRYAKVIEADGSPMTIRAALGLINQALDEILAAQEGDFDADTRFAVTWFEQHGSSEGPYGEADVLARAKNTAVRGLEDAGVLVSRAGKVRLLQRQELPEEWHPAADLRLTVWEVTQHLIRRLETRGEAAAASLLSQVGGLGETARELAYRLYTVCERKGWAQEALGYNALVVSWPEIVRLSADQADDSEQQMLRV